MRMETSMGSGHNVQLPAETINQTETLSWSATDRSISMANHQLTRNPVKQVTGIDSVLVIVASMRWSTGGLRRSTMVYVMLSGVYRSAGLTPSMQTPQLLDCLLLGQGTRGTFCLIGEKGASWHDSCQGIMTSSKKVWVKTLQKNGTRRNSSFCYRA
jgi:hypothetical protein